MSGVQRRPPWPPGSKLRAIALEGFVRLFSFPFASVSLGEIVSPKRRCVRCDSRLLTTLDTARVHAQAPDGLAMRANPSLHRCLRCHELTAFLSPVADEGVAVPIEDEDSWIEKLFPGMSRC